MSSNISKDYISFSKKNIITYAKMILEKQYQKEYFNTLLDTYICVRYYNYYEDIYKTLGPNINYYLKNKVIELIKEHPDKNKKTIENNYLVFKYILYLDNVIELESPNELILDIVNFRKKELLIDNNDNFTKEFLTLVKTNEKRKKHYLEELNNNIFNLNITKTNQKNTFLINLSYHITFPKIYSEYSINKVYNSGVINEDKIFITCHLVNKQILSNAIKGIYNQNYIVDFPLTIFDKNEKITRLLNTINEEIVKEHIILSIGYNNYLTHKEKILAYIKEGYKFAVELDETFDYKEKSKIWLDIFTYIIINTPSSYSFDEEKIIIKK